MARIKPPKPKFVADAPVPSSKLSAVADLADYAATQPACIVTRAATQSLTNNVAALVSFDTTIWDPDVMLGTATNVLPPDGIYTVTGWVEIAASAVGVRVLEITQNGLITTSFSMDAPATANARLTICTTLLVVTGDAIGLQAFQLSGGNLNIVGARLGVVRVSGS